MRKKIVIIWLGSHSLSLGCLTAEPMGIESVGVRYAVSSSSLSPLFHQAEAAALLRLPWDWDLGADLRLFTKIDTSAGVMTRRGDNGFVGTLGPSLLLGYKSWPLFLDVGISPTVLSRQQFGDRFFGSPFQLTSHGGLRWDIGRHWSLGYRFQHMSNAGTASPNPGLNMHSFGLSWRF